MEKVYHQESFEDRNAFVGMRQAADFIEKLESEYECVIGVYFKIEDIVSRYDQEFDNWEIVVYYSFKK